MAKNKTCKWELDKVIKDLISEIAPGCEELYLSSFDEIQCLKDVTKELRERKQTIDNMFAINESLHQSLEDLEKKLAEVYDSIARNGI
jgi:acyl carrier protein phosphodiesterase